MKRITTGLVLVGACLFAAAFGAGFAIYLKPVEASRNSSGTYALPTPGVPFQSNQTISSTQVNNTLNDIATALTDSKSKSGLGDFTAAVRGVDGTVASPAYSYTSDTGTGQYRIGSGDLGWSISGTKKLELTGTLLTVVPNATFGGTLGVTAGATSLNLGTTGTGTAAALTVTNSDTYQLFVVPRASAAAYNSLVQAGDTLLTFDRNNVADTGALVIANHSAGSNGVRMTATGTSVVGGLTVGASGTAISASIAGTASITPGTVGANSCFGGTITVTGGTSGAPCVLGSPGINVALAGTCSMAGGNTCNIQLCNPTGLGVAAPSGTYTCRVFNP